MPKFSEKFKGKEIGSAAVYAKPHSMTGGTMKMEKPSDPNKMAANKQTTRSQAGRVSAGDPAADMTKTSGIKMRGTGAATKGKMSRGPMG